MRTPLERQQEAETEFRALLETRSTDRVAIGDAMRSMLSTAQAATSHAPPPPFGNHVCFADEHKNFYVDLMIHVVDSIRTNVPAKSIYAQIVEDVRRQGLALTPWPVVAPSTQAA